MVADFKDNGSWVRVRLDAKLIELLHEKRIFSTARHDQPTRWAPGTAVMFTKNVVIEPYSAVYMAELLYTMGSFSFVSTPFNIAAYSLQITFGRYCSIGGGARIIGPAHPLDAVSSATAFFDPTINMVAAYADDNGLKISAPLIPRPKAKGPPIIGHDVWFGGEVCLNTGVKIGNGAVVAANSVVTRDVPDYAIVGGNPAKIIRFRFPAEIVEELLRLQPWRFSLMDLARFNLSDVPAFLRELEDAKDDVTPHTPEKIELWKEYRLLHEF